MSPALRIVAAQAGIGTTSAVLFFFIGWAAGLSALMALVCVVLPTLFHALIQQCTRNAAWVLAQSVVRTALTVILMTVCIAYIGIEPLAFFVTFVATQLGYWQGLTRHQRKTEQ